MAEMEKVSKEVFWAFIMAEKRDIMPKSERHQSVWEQAHTRKVFGLSTPGYLCEGPEEYFLIPEAANAGREALKKGEMA